MNPITAALTDMAQGVRWIWEVAFRPVVDWAVANPKGVLVALVILAVVLVATRGGGSTTRTHGPGTVCPSCRERDGHHAPWCLIKNK